MKPTLARWIVSACVLGLLALFRWAERTDTPAPSELDVATPGDAGGAGLSSDNTGA